MTTGIARFPIRDLRRLSIQDALGRILKGLGAETGTVHRLGADGQLHLEVYEGGIPANLLPVITRIPIGKGMAGAAAQRLEPVQTCDLQVDSSGDIRPGARVTGMRGSLCVPMMNGGRLAGVLGVAVRGERQFSDAEIAWLLRAGEILARDNGD